MFARQQGHAAFAKRVARLPLTRPWSVPWANWSHDSLHRLVGRHRGSVNSIAFPELGSKRLIVSGGADKKICVWDIATGQSLGQPIVGHNGSVNAVAVQALNGRPLIVSGGDDGTVRVWDLENGMPCLGPVSGHEGPVLSISVGLSRTGQLLYLEVQTRQCGVGI
jgi:WD40 repeat protein